MYISDVLKILNVEKEGQLDRLGAQKLLMPLLNKIKPSESIDSKLAFLYKGVFCDDINEFIGQDKKLDDFSCVKLNIMLKNGELSLDEMVACASRPFVQNLSCESVLSIAEKTADHSPGDFLNLMKNAVRKIDNIRLLNKALEISKTINLETIAKENFVETRIAIVGNCTLKPLNDFLNVGMLHYGLNSETMEVPFDQWAQQFLDTSSELYGFNPSFVILYLSSLGLTSSATKRPLEIFNLLERCLNSFAKNNASRVIMILPEPLEEEYYTSSQFHTWRKHYIEEVSSRFQSRMVFIDPTPIIADVGCKNWFASRFWYHAKMPCHPNAMISLGQYVANTVARCITSPIKVVVCDLDNVLWGGIVGEDGWENLHLDVHSTGGPFVRLQAYLRGFVERGILLIAVSKNNEDDVCEVFSKRNDEMVLKWEDFTMVLANWEPKSKNIVQAAQKLNIDVKHFCFIDDSSFEREEVRHTLPEVIVPELPTAPEDYVSFLIKTGFFHVPIMTEEDAQRNKLYRNEAKRMDAREESGNIDTFLKELQIKAYPLKITSENIGRVVQLINKTNQFNLTTKRYDYEGVRKYVEDEKIYAYCYRICDIFGDSGIAGVLIVSPDGAEDRYTIDTWLLSCRVIGRTVEQGIFEHLLSWLKSRNIKFLMGEYISTGKNQIVADLYTRLGFREKKVGGHRRCVYEYDTDILYQNNRYVELCERNYVGNNV